MPKAASFAPPLPFLFDRDVNHDGREFDIRGGIWGGEDNGGKYLARKKAGER